MKTLLKQIYRNLDYRFIIILSVGIVLRIISLIFLPIPNDARGYIRAAESILAGNYNSFRPPSFPLLIVLFLLLVKDSTLAVKLASFTSGIFTIITSYFVFTKASLRIFGDDKKGEDISKNVGLLVSFYVSINFFLVYNTGLGLREELMMLLLLLIFYYVFLNEDSKVLTNLLILVLLISFFTLVHATAGIFLYISIFCFYTISKLKFVKNILKNEVKISNFRFLIISLSFFSSISFWLIFCAYHFGDPLYTFNMLKFHWRTNSNLDLDIRSPSSIINLLKFSFENGFNREFFTLFYLIGPIFTLIISLTFLKYYKFKQINFIYVFLAINFLYLSIFMAVHGAYRFLIYFFPFLFFLGSIIIIQIWYENKKTEIIHFRIMKKKISVSNNQIFLLYLFVFTCKNLLSLYNYISDISYSQKNILLIGISYALLLIYELILFLFLLRNINISVNLKSYNTQL